MIKWITENIGTGAYSDVVKDISKNIKLVDVRDMVDKSGNSLGVINKKIDTSLGYLKKGYRVVICCDYGKSRSNSIAAGVISKNNNKEFNEALNIVLKKTTEKEIDLSVVSMVRSVVCGPKNRKQKNKSKNILITGASGFIGKSLFARLDNDNKYKVFPLLRRDVDLINNPLLFDVVVNDKKIDTIVHLANPRIYTLKESMGKTLVMLKNVLDVCRENNIKLIFVSTWMVYSGYISQSLKINESFELFARGTYGETKYLSEKLVELYKKNYKLETAILRSAPVYGQGSDKPKFIYNFIDKALQNKNITTHKYQNGFPKMDLLHLDDFVRAIVMAIENNFTGELNLGSGRLHSTKDIAEMIIKIIGSKSKIEHEQIKEKVSNIMMDYTLAKKELNWEPQIKLIDGLKSLIRDYEK